MHFIRALRLKPPLPYGFRFAHGFVMHRRCMQRLYFAALQAANAKTFLFFLFYLLAYKSNNTQRESAIIENL